MEWSIDRWWMRERKRRLRMLLATPSTAPGIPLTDIITTASQTSDELPNPREWLKSAMKSRLTGETRQ